MAEEIHLSLKSGGRKDTFLTELVTTIGWRDGSAVN